MVKVTIEVDGRLVKTIYGQAVFGTMVNPVSEESNGADCMAFGVGETSVNAATQAMASASGTLLQRMVNDPFGIIPVSLKFVDKFSDAIFENEGSIKAKNISRTVFPAGGGTGRQWPWDR